MTPGLAEGCGTWVNCVTGGSGSLTGEAAYPVKAPVREGGQSYYAEGAGS